MVKERRKHGTEMGGGEGQAGVAGGSEEGRLWEKGAASGDRHTQSAEMISFQKTRPSSPSHVI